MRISDWSSDVCSSDLVVPALAVILTAALMRAIASLRKAYRVRGTTNLVSGMPNLEALRQVSAPSSGIIVAARIKNSAQITKSLEPDRKSVEEGKRVLERVDSGGGRKIKKKQKK